MFNPCTAHHFQPYFTALSATSQGDHRFWLAKWLAKGTMNQPRTILYICLEGKRDALRQVLALCTGPISSSVTSAL
jgi:hypothetical protein